MAFGGGAIFKFLPGDLARDHALANALERISRIHCAQELFFFEIQCLNVFGENRSGSMENVEGRPMDNP